VERVVVREACAFAIEIADELLCRNDERIFLQLPARRLLSSRKELQAGGIERGEVHFLVRHRGARRRIAIAVAVAGEEKRKQKEGGGNAPRLRHRTSDSRNSIVTRTPAPVAPLASRGVSCSV